MFNIRESSETLGVVNVMNPVSNDFCFCKRASLPLLCGPPHLLCGDWENPRTCRGKEREDHSIRQVEILVQIEPLSSVNQLHIPLTDTEEAAIWGFTDVG